MAALVYALYAYTVMGAAIIFVTWVFYQTCVECKRKPEAGGSEHLVEPNVLNAEQESASERQSGGEPESEMDS